MLNARCVRCGVSTQKALKVTKAQFFYQICEYFVWHSTQKPNYTRGLREAVTFPWSILIIAVRDTFRPVEGADYCSIYYTIRLGRTIFLIYTYL